MAEIPVVAWSTFTDRLEWNAGEHVTIIGTTDSGKSHLATELLQLRRWSVVLGTKPRDETLERFRDLGWARIGRWPAPQHERILLWPKVREPEDLAEQGPIFADALDAIFVEGAWVVYVDELPYLTRRLGLGDKIELFWYQGRALGISLVVSTQRPAHVPLLAYSQARHLFLFRTTERRDLDRLSEIGGAVNTDRITHVAGRLPAHAFLHVNTRTGRLTISRAPHPDTRR